MLHKMEQDLLKVSDLLIYPHLTPALPCFTPSLTSQPPKGTTCLLNMAQGCQGLVLSYVSSPSPHPPSRPRSTELLSHFPPPSPPLPPRRPVLLSPLPRTPHSACSQLGCCARGQPLRAQAWVQRPSLRSSGFVSAGFPVLISTGPESADPA